MLYEDEPTLFVNHLQIKRDFQNPNQFYYFPPAPRIHRDPTTGRPAFQLLKYARDITDNPNFSAETREQVGGAFLTMTVDIGVDEEVLADTRNKLGAYATGEVVLAPVAFHTGSVRLLALGVEGGPIGQVPAQPANVFVERVFGTTKPSLYGDNLALFGLHLNQEGATLVQDSFEHGGNLLGVIYDMTYTAIRPAIQVKAEVDYSRVYDRFEAQIGFQYAMIGVELDATLEWLREQGDIKIEITEYDPAQTSENALRREAMDLIKNEIIAKMFKPSLAIPRAATRSTNPLEQVMRLSQDLSRPPTNPSTPASGGTTLDTTPAPVTEGERGPHSMDGREAAPGSGSQAAGSGSSAGFALSFSLKFVHQDERRRATFDFRVNQAVNRVAAPQGSLALMKEQLADTPLSELIREVNLDDEFFRELRAQISVTGDFAELGIDKVVVNATYQPDPDGSIVHTDGWTFLSATDAAKSFNALIDRKHPQRLYRYKTQVFLKDAANIDAPHRVLSKESVSEQRDLVIHPANEFTPLLISIDPSLLDWTKLRHVGVKLGYTDERNAFACNQRFGFTSSANSVQKWVIYPSDPQLRTYQVQLSYQLTDGSTFTLEPLPHSDEAFLVPPAFRGNRPVRLLPAVDSEETQELSVDLLFEKGGYRYFRQELFSEGDFNARTIDIPVPDPDPRTDEYQARWALTKADFEVVSFDWQKFKTQQCVLSDGRHGVARVKLVFTRSVAQAGLTSLLVTLESIDDAGNPIDADTLLLREAEYEAATDLLTEQGKPLRYRYQLKRITGDTSTTGAFALEDQRTAFVEL